MMLFEEKGKYSLRRDYDSENVRTASYKWW